MPQQNIAWFKDIDNDDLSYAGEKGANIGEIAKAGFQVPEGFIITSHAFHNFSKKASLEIKISKLISSINFNDPDSLNQVSEHIENDFKKANIPAELEEEINSAYEKILNLSKDTHVVVNSSITTDLPHALFNRHETFFYIKNKDDLMISIKACWASLYNAQTISDIHSYKLENHKIGIAIVVQKMIRPEKSGVLFTKTKKVNKELPEISILKAKLEKHYFFPQEVHWEIEKGKIYLVQVKNTTD